MPESTASHDASHDSSIPAKQLLVAPILILSAWGSGLGVAAFWIWTAGVVIASSVQSFLLVASLFGALGGLIDAIRALQANVYQLWKLERESSPDILGSPLNNYFVKPLLWPLAGAAIGLVLSAMLLDEGTGLLKVALLGTVGGMLWQTILRKLPGILNLTGK